MDNEVVTRDGSISSEREEQGVTDFPRNGNGQTYGSLADGDPLNPPDLILAISNDRTMESLAITYANSERTEFTCRVGDRVPLSARLEPAGAGTAGEITWASDNPSVLEVVPSNLEGTNVQVTAIGNGTATLTVSAGGLEATCIVRVRGDYDDNSEDTATQIQSVAIMYADQEQKEFTCRVGEVVPLSVRVSPDDAETEMEIFWCNSDRNVFEALPTDLAGIDVEVMGLSVGTATLTVSVNGIEATCTVRVRAPR